MQTDIRNEKFVSGKTRIKYGGAFIAEEERKAIDSVLDRNWWTLDEQGRKMEEELAQKTGVMHAVLTNSGSSALLLAVTALEMKKGSEVIIPALNFPTAVSACLYNNLIPVFVDVDPETYCIKIDEIEAAISDKTEAIMIVNIAGNLPDMDRIQEIAKKHNLKTIVDNCDGYGSTWDGQFSEKVCTISTTSFHAAHILAMGEGGAVFTDNYDLAKRVKSLREWGRAADNDASIKSSELPDDYPARYTYITRGFNVKPLELQAAMGRVQLTKLDMIKEARRKNFDLLHDGLSKLSDKITLASVHDKSDISWFSFPFTIKETGQRKKLMDFLEARNIETRVIFAGNVIRQPAYQNINYRKISDLKNSDKIMYDSIFVSVHPSITEEMIQYVIQSITEFFA